MLGARAVVITEHFNIAKADIIASIIKIEPDPSITSRGADKSQNIQETLLGTIVYFRP